MFIDTHTHLYAEEFDNDRNTVVKKALASGIKKFYLPNIDSSSIAGMFKLEKEYPENCFAMMGLLSHSSTIFISSSTFSFTEHGCRPIIAKQFSGYSFSNIRLSNR